MDASETKRIGDPPAENLEFWDLRLYVAGQSQKSCAAIANLKRICEEYLPGQYHVEVIDLVENPKLARGDQIVAIPTLIRKLPVPLRRVIGDLSNTERALVGLQIRPRGEAGGPSTGGSTVPGSEAL